MGRSIKLRVKAKRPGIDCFRWSAKADGSILLGLDPADATDIVAAVSFYASGGYDVYILSSGIVEKCLCENHTAYLAQPKRDGTPRKNSTQRNLYMNDQENKPGHGYAKLWLKYCNNWDVFSSC